MHKPVWYEKLPHGARPRIDRILFRRVFVSEAVPTTARIHLLARSRYVLRVNGAELGTGPVRSYPEFHEYDSYDLATAIVPGKNVLEVEVLHWNMATFHNLLEAPGFEAWGEIVSHPGAGSIDLSTPGDWRCRRREGMDPTSPRLSFAQPPVESIDFRVDSDLETDWRIPVIAEPDPTPCPAPRSIPPLTRLPLVPAAMAVATARDSGELVFGARAVDDGSGTNPFPPRDSSAALAVWIHSPSAQHVKAKGWWGEYRLNDVPIAPAPGSFPLCQTLVFSLRAGWNALVVSQGLAFGYAEICIALPHNAGLSLRSAPDFSAPKGFLFTGPFPSTELDAILREPITAGPMWRELPMDALPPSPLRHIAWLTPADESHGADPSEAIPFAPGRTTIATFDMGRLVLGRLSLDLDAPSGTLIDIAHAEECRAASGPTPLTRPRIEKAVVVYGADRWIAAEGRRTYTLLLPRGFRYLEIAISVPADSHAAILHRAVVLEERYPHRLDAMPTGLPPDFARLWSYGIRTFELCCHDVFIDCPWRERTLYGGDLLAETAACVALTRDLRLVRHSLDVILQSIGPAGWLESNAPAPRDVSSLGEYPLLTSIAAGWYLRLTSDTAFAKRAWPVFRTMAETSARWRRADGIYALPGRSFIDHGHRLSSGPTCEFNAALVAALRAWSETARCVGDVESADQLDERADALDELLPKAFFDTTAGSFRDLPLADGGDTTEGTPANTWALLFTRSARVLSKTVVAAIRAAVATFDPANEHESVSPYQMFYLLAALLIAGERTLAEESIRAVYAPMLDHPTGTLWEHARTDASLVHAWSCGPLFYFVAVSRGHCLGLDFTRPVPPSLHNGWDNA